MAAAGELTPERDGREGVARVAEGGEEETPPAGSSRLAGCARMFSLVAQTSSASSRTRRLRSSASNDIGEMSSVPTPASR